jgi:hypothetical protein
MRRQQAVQLLECGSSATSLSHLHPDVPSPVTITVLSKPFVHEQSASTAIKSTFVSLNNFHLLYAVERAASADKDHGGAQSEITRMISPQGLQM